jgi:lipoate---protein ligase
VIVEVHRGPAAALHGRTMPTDGQPRVWVLEADAPAVVLGSTQPDDVVDRAAAERAGVEVVRRRSGGGAVWVGPGDPIWVDVVLPRHDRRWDDDVGRAFLPVGRAWRAALAGVGVDATVHEGAMVRTEYSDLICFAGTGPGEVFVDGAKVVGISQRRTRDGARFQCAIPRVWDPTSLLELLDVDVDPAALGHAGHGVGDVDAGELVAGLVAALDAP